jgi:hypothetical protein
MTYSFLQKFFWRGFGWTKSHLRDSAFFGFFFRGARRLDGIIPSIS